MSATKFEITMQNNAHLPEVKQATHDTTQILAWAVELLHMYMKHTKKPDIRILTKHTNNVHNAGLYIKQAWKQKVNLK